MSSARPAQPSATEVADPKTDPTPPSLVQPAAPETGTATLPRRIAPGQSLPVEADGEWVEVEGEVTFVGEQKEGLMMEISSGASLMRVNIEEASAAAPLLLLRSHIRAVGQCRLTMTLDGDFLAGTLRVSTLEGVQVLKWASSHWTAYPLQAISSLPQTNLAAFRDRIVHLGGTVARLKRDRTMVLQDTTRETMVEWLDAVPPEEGAHVEVLGRLGRRGTNIVLRGGGYRNVEPAGQPEPVLRELTRVEQIKSLSPVEAQKGYPVRIRGVVTSVLKKGFFVQDATRAVYVSAPEGPGQGLPTLSEYCEVEGVTYEDFAPSVRLARMTRLAPGVMPEPLRATWDQLINGSLDAQYVEVQGVVTWAQANEMSLLTRSGKLTIRLVEAPPRLLKNYEGALIRVRGCVIPGRDSSTLQVHLGRIELSNCSISMDEPAPSDPFAVPSRRISELLLFNWHASAIQRVRTSGQVIHSRGGEYFITDGTNGLRFIPKVPVVLPVGEQVEVVGFLRFSGPSPVLAEGLARQHGVAPLPSPKELQEDSLLSHRHDATLVRVRGRLIASSLRSSEQVFELRAGNLTFLTRLQAGARWNGTLVPGSLLEVIGVFAGVGGDRASLREITSFEVLLNSPQSILVIQQPPWWTLQKALWVLGGTSALATLSLGWVVTLKREAHRKTGVIQQKAEREAVLEERTRIAREFHDTIEQQVAAVSLQLQAARARLEKSPDFVRHALQLAESMLRHAQYEARHSVWNLRARSLEQGGLEEALRTVANYARNGADVQIEVNIQGEPQPLPGRTENHLLRISQEAIANSIKHGQAKVVRLDLNYHADSIQLNIIDDGKGFDVGAAPSGGSGHFGLLGMRERAEKMGGTLTVKSNPGKGTELVLIAPLIETSVPALITK